MLTIAAWCCVVRLTEPDIIIHEAQRLEDHRFIQRMGELLSSGTRAGFLAGHSRLASTRYSISLKGRSKETRAPCLARYAGNDGSGLLSQTVCGCRHPLEGTGRGD